MRIVNQRIDVSAMGFEPGHQIIDAGGALHDSSVGGQGFDLEGYISVQQFLNATEKPLNH